MVSESKTAIEDRLSPTLRLVLAVAFAIIGSIDGILIIAKFVAQNMQLTVGLLVIVVVMFAVAWLMYVRRLWLVLVVILGVSIVALIPLWIWVANTKIEPINVTITYPQDGESVEMVNLVKGEVSDLDAQVYVLVHPLESRESWVQNPPIVGLDGSWKTSCFFGIEISEGEQFEVIALATKENFLVNLATGNNLRVGQTLERLPQKTNRSNLVTVTRSK